MPGGARARSGPAPDPNALRRNRPSDQAEWLELPASGRSGPPPVWPLDGVTEAELLQWAKEWARPQALEWERRRQFDEVAAFVRAFLISVGPKATAADRNVVQRMGTDLGMTSPGLRALRWRIVDDSPPARAAR